jgi:hypothetical protein
MRHLVPTRRQLWSSIPLFFILQKCFRDDIPLFDFWWHLKMGEIILAERAIPRFDAFSFTVTGNLFIVQNWLSEVILYGVYRCGGYELLLFLNALIFISVIFIVYRLCLQLSQNLWASVLAATVVALGIASNLRPQIFSFMLFALFYSILASHYSSGGRRIYWLPVLMLFWVNTHGAFVLGLGLIGIYLLVEAIDYRMDSLKGLSRSHGGLFGLASVLLLSILATLVNPEGYGVYDYIITVVNDPSSQLFVMEWQPPAIKTIGGILMFFLPFFLTMVALVLSEKRPSLIDLTLFACFSIFALTAVRNCAWFLMIVGPILARYLALVPWANLASTLWRGNRTKKMGMEITSTQKMRGINLAVAALLIVLVVVKSPWWRSQYLGDSLLKAEIPVGAVDYIEQNDLRGNIFHLQGYGDYMLWRLWPKQKVFFDGRVHIYGEEFVRAYLEIMQGIDWEERLSKQNIRFVLLPKDNTEKGARGLIGKIRHSSSWKLLFEDENSVLWEKRDS